MFEIIYDYDDGWTETRNISETFTGTWDDGVKQIKFKRTNEASTWESNCLKDTDLLPTNRL